MAIGRNSLKDPKGGGRPAGVGPVVPRQGVGVLFLAATGDGWAEEHPAESDLDPMGTGRHLECLRFPPSEFANFGPVDEDLVPPEQIAQRADPALDSHVHGCRCHGQAFSQG